MRRMLPPSCELEHCEMREPGTIAALSHYCHFGVRSLEVSYKWARRGKLEKRELVREVIEHLTCYSQKRTFSRALQRARSCRSRVRTDKDNRHHRDPQTALSMIADDAAVGGAFNDCCFLPQNLQSTAQNNPFSRHNQYCQADFSGAHETIPSESTANSCRCYSRGERPRRAQAALRHLR
jgi:hypothetical protein